MSFPWNNEDAPTQKGKKCKAPTQAQSNNIFGAEEAAPFRNKAPLQPSSYNIISGDNTQDASDRQPKMAVWSAKDYVVHKAGRVASQGGETPFSSQNQSPSDDRFARAPKVGDFKVGDSNQAYKNNRQAADQLQRRTQASEAGACIFGR